MNCEFLNLSLFFRGSLEHITRAYKSVTPSFLQAIISGRVYVLRYPLCDDLPTQDDITDFDPTRKMRRTQSPVALFVSAPDAPGGLRPVAIQMDYTPGEKEAGEAGELLVTALSNDSGKQSRDYFGCAFE